MFEAILKFLGFGVWFSHRVAIYVPGTMDVTGAMSPDEHEALVKEVLTFLSERFGGGTAAPAMGGYLADDGTLVIEKVTIVYSFCKRLSRSDAAALYALAADIRDRCGQEAVAVEVNRRLKFV